MKDDDETLSGELVPWNRASEFMERLKRELRKDEIERRVTESARQPAFVSKIRTKRTDEATGLVNAESRLAEALVGRGRAVDRMMDIETILKTDREQRADNLEEAQGGRQMRKLQRELDILKFQKQIAELRGEKPDPRDEKRKKFEAMQEDAEYEIARSVFFMEKDFNKAEALLKRRDEMIEAIKKGSGGNLTAEQEQKIENIMDLAQREIDRL